MNGEPYVPSAFEEALGLAMTSAASDGSTIRTPVRAAIAVVRSPEMLAIRRWMLWAFDATVGVDDTTNDAEPDLPDSVIGWMDGTS